MAPCELIKAAKIIMSERYRVDVPDGKRGDWSVETFEVTEKEAMFSEMRAALGHPLARVKAGTYKRLRQGKAIVMSNTPMEISTNLYFMTKARGKVLINGLGLGMVLKAILEKRDVEEVTVIEASEDVIALVAPTFADDPRVTIIHACAFEYQPPKGKRYDFVWHDIWTYITASNLPEMHKLHRKYGRIADQQASWCRAECERMRNEYNQRRALHES